MLPLIQSLGLTHHITNSHKPTVDKRTYDGTNIANLEFATWKINDGLLTFWMLGIMTEEVLSSIIGIESAYKLWGSLEDQLLPTTKEKEVHLRDRLLIIEKEQSNCRRVHRKFNHLCDSLAAINKPVDDLDKVFNFVRGLGAKYRDFRLAMLTKPPYPTFKQYLTALENHDHKNVFNQSQAFLSLRGKRRVVVVESKPC